MSNIEWDPVLLHGTPILPHGKGEGAAFQAARVPEYLFQGETSPADCHLSKTQLNQRFPESIQQDPLRIEAGLVVSTCVDDGIRIG